MIFFSLQIGLLVNLTSDISVRLLYGLKNIAIDLWDKRSISAFKKRIPCTVLISSLDTFVSNIQCRFLSKANTVSHSSTDIKVFNNIKLK